MEATANRTVQQTKQRVTIDSPKLVIQQRRLALVTLVAPAVGAAAAVGWAVRFGLHASSVYTAGGLYALTTAGLTVGFHRLFTHKSFKAKAPTRVLLAIFGMMAAQGPLLFWVASHRRHHVYSDREEDCHSPLKHGTTGLWNRLRGLWHAHFGWMLASEITNVPVFAKDLLHDELIVHLNRHYLTWVGIGLAVPALIGWATVGGGPGAIEGLLLGGLARIFFVHQITWGLNSLNHVFGVRRYSNDDNSRNIAWLALITMGEGWHNNHHAHPTSARFGHAWWEIDMGFTLIRLLRLVGQCAEVRLPNDEFLSKRSLASR